MAAIANTVGRQFGENAEDWLANSNTKSLSIYDENAFSFLPTDYSSQQPMYGDASRLNGSLPDTPIQLPTIHLQASQEIDIDEARNIAYALSGVNSAYNMSAALAGIQQKAMQQGGEARPLNSLEAFYQTQVGSHVNAWNNGVMNLYKGGLALAREIAYTSYDVSIGSILKDVNPKHKSVSWFAQSVENNGIVSTAKDMVGGTVTGVFEPLRALNRGNYVDFTEAVPGLIASAMGTRASFLPTKSNRFDFQVNQQGIPYSYLENISDITGSEIKLLEGKYYALEASGADYKSVIRDYVDSNKFGVNLEDAHYIMGYTTNFFQKRLK